MRFETPRSFIKHNWRVGGDHWLTTENVIALVVLFTLIVSHDVSNALTEQLGPWSLGQSENPEEQRNTYSHSSKLSHPLSVVSEAYVNIISDCLTSVWFRSLGFLHRSPVQKILSVVLRCRQSPILMERFWFHWKLEPWTNLAPWIGSAVEGPWFFQDLLLKHADIQRTDKKTSHPFLVPVV